MYSPALKTLKNARAWTTLLTALFLAHTSVSAEAVQTTLEFTLQKTRLRIDVPPGARAKPNHDLGMLIVQNGQTLVQITTSTKARFSKEDTQQLDELGSDAFVWLEKNDHELYYKARVFGATSNWFFSSYARRDLGGITVTCGLDFSSARAVEAARKACKSLRRS